MIIHVFLCLYLLIYYFDVYIILMDMYVVHVCCLYCVAFMTTFLHSHTIGHTEFSNRCVTTVKHFTSQSNKSTVFSYYVGSH